MSAFPELSPSMSSEISRKYAAPESISIAIPDPASLLIDHALFPNKPDRAETTDFGQVSKETSYQREFTALPLSVLSSVGVVQDNATSFYAVQKWQGYVEEILESEGIFRAHLTTTLGEGHEQDAELYLDAVDPADSDLVRVGAVFYCNIGYWTSGGSQKRGFILRFRRLPVWTRYQLEEAKEETRRESELLQLPTLDEVLKRGQEALSSAPNRVIVISRDD